MASFNPPKHEHILVTFPTAHIMLATVNRPREMNCISTSMHIYLSDLWAWYDATPSLWCAIITGAPAAPGRKRAFCAGADLKEWQVASTSASTGTRSHTGGFMGLSQRGGKKPVIAAVDGICFGGGMETTLNCDLVICTPDSIFALPEVKRGVVAIVGGLQRLAVTVGLQRASELALTGRTIGAVEAKEWGLVNEIVKGDVVEHAVRWAKMIEENSPDSVIVSRRALRGTGVYGGVADASQQDVEKGVWAGLQAGENYKEGLKAFVEKRPVRWVDSKL